MDKNSFENTTTWDKGPQTLSVKDQGVVNTFVFVSHSVYATTQLCHRCIKVATENMYGHGWVLIKFYLQKQVSSWIWPTGHHLPAPDLEEAFQKYIKSGYIRSTYNHKMAPKPEFPYNY